MSEVGDNFIQIPFSLSNLDRYLIRSSIKAAIDWALPALNGRLLDAGCGKMPYREYILKHSAVREYVGLDIETALVYDEHIKPDYTWDGRTMPFENDGFESCIATEVLEHCPEPEILLREVHRVLKPGGVLFFTVPFLWNLHEVPRDEYRYTPFALERHLRNSGFVETELRASGGWHASLAQMLGLWARRSPLSPRKRALLSVLIKPIMQYLIARDRDFGYSFAEGQMITGLYGLAKKKQG
jgi:SAM-dependent methyltransferase